MLGAVTPTNLAVHNSAPPIREGHGGRINTALSHVVGEANGGANIQRMDVQSLLKFLALSHFLIYLMYLFYVRHMVLKMFAK
jgi:hypothetical protein